MKETVNFLAIDLGASSGRVLLGQWDGAHFNVRELHRFANGPVDLLGHQHWDVLCIWAEIKRGLTKYTAQFDRPLAGVGVDTWGVDFALLDSEGHLLGNPYHYRDPRTDGMMELVFQRVPRSEVFDHTGIQFLQLNTLYQLFSMALNKDPQLEMAGTLLMTPDLFHYWLTGRKATEFTIATTSQMFNVRECRWATEMLTQLGIPTHFLLPVVSPGTVLGDMRPELMSEVDLRQPVPVIAPGSHDTASAVAAIPGLDAESAYISSGTWCIIGVEIPDPIVNEQALNLGFSNEGGVANTTRLLTNVMGLWLLQESRRQWQREGHDHTWDELLTLAEDVAPFHSLIDPDSPDFLYPGDMPSAIRSYCRRTGQPEPSSAGSVVRCCLESLALKYRWFLDALEMLTGQQLRTIRIVGGGSQNRLLSQFTADACQRPVATGPVEATALGNALLQAIATGHLPDISAGRQAIADSLSQEYFEPGSSGAWEEAFARFNALLYP